jgi:putative heme transporter
MSAPEDQAVHPLIRKSAAWAWRMLLLLAAIVAVLWLIRRFELIVVPVALALMLTALLLPGVDWLNKHHVPRGVAVFLLLLIGTSVLGGILAFVISQFIDGVPKLAQQVTHSFESARAWLIHVRLVHGPAHLTQDQLKNAAESIIDAVRRNQAKVTSGALATAATFTEVVTGAFIALFTLIFFLYGGRNIYRFVTQVFPTSVREKVRAAGKAGFGALIGYVRATFLVALVDATGIGSGLAIMGVPLALPLASLVFLGAFVPLVGAVVAGFIAVVVALIAKGFVYALITLGLIIAVQQLEGHVLQPLVMGRAVSIHPLAVVLGISTGGVLGGIVGALLAVPTIAFADRVVRVLIEPEAVADEEEAVTISAQPDTIT